MKAPERLSRFFYLLVWTYTATAFGNCSVWHLLVRPEKSIEVNLNNGVGFQGHVHVFQDPDGQPLGTVELTSASAKDAELKVVIERVKGTKTTFALPPGIGQRVVQYLLEKPAEPFDCNCFVHYANGIPVAFGGVAPESWKFRSFDEKALQPGDTVLMGNMTSPGNMRPTHAALYLGDGLYLSKFGTGGGLIVASLHEMAKGFEASTAIIMEPVH